MQSPNSLSRKKFCCLTLLLVFSIDISAQSFNNKSTSPAETAFDELDSIRYARRKYPGSKNSSDFTRYSEENAMNYRQIGLQLWNQYPENTRKYDWLVRSINMLKYPNYWNDIDSAALAFTERPHSAASYNAAINWDALHEWEQKYSEMKGQLMDFVQKNDPGNYEENKYEMNNSELKEFLRLSLNEQYRKNGKIDLVQLKNLFVAAGEKNIEKINWEDLESSPRWRFDVLRIIDNDFIARYPEYGLSELEVIQFIDTLKSEKDRGIKYWARQRNNLFKLTNEPMDLKGTATDGRKIDLREMKGNVVLVDFWATSCSSCVKRMPFLKKMYDKYKGQGFKVISACLNHDDEMQKIMEINRKIDADWPVLLIGYTNQTERHLSLGAKIWKQYGFWGVPQLLLFDKKGNLVMLNNLLRSGDFEPLLKKLLSE